jgi:hypothetical protein
LIVYRGDALDGGFDLERVKVVIKDGVIFVSDYRWVGPAVFPSPEDNGTPRKHRTNR